MSVKKSQDGTQSKADLAYSVLKGRILDQTYGPGYRIVVDQIARETGLSNNPLREAIRRLEAEGWLEIVRNTGARVATFDVEDHRHTLELLARLEGFATALAAPHLDDHDIARARRINEQMREALDLFDPVGFADLNRQFHETLYAKCDSAHLRALLASELQRFDIIRRSVHSTVPGRARSSLDEHDVLLDLLESGAPADEVEAYARQHKLNGLRTPRVAEGV